VQKNGYPSSKPEQNDQATTYLITYTELWTNGDQLAQERFQKKAIELDYLWRRIYSSNESLLYKCQEEN
jgi:hypothetical protein